MAKPTASQLQQHVTDDPNGIGLTWGKDNIVLRGLLNQEAFGTVERSTIRGSEIANAIVPSEFDLLLATQQDKVKWTTQLGDEINVSSGTNVRSTLAGIFGSGTQTRQNLIDVVNRDATYAEVQWGRGVSITLDDLRAARP